MAAKSVGAALLALLSASCVVGPEARFARFVAEGAYCAPRERVDPLQGPRTADDPTLPARAAVEQGYTARSLDMARAIGALAEVERFADAVARHAPDGEVAALRGEVNDTITVASLDLASTTSHLACEEGRAAQIATDLRTAEQAQTRRLTAWSLLLGATATVIGGVLAIADKDPVPGGVVGISGGVTGGALGFATLSVHRSTTFRHAPNILGEVWRGGPHPSFPEIVWAYLTRPQFSRTGDRTIRDYLVTSWQQSELQGDDGRIALYFGEGGTYDVSGLDDRANMLSDVREAVSLMNHGLQHLAAEVARH
ncbi:MAG: hypothetical protein ABSE49_12925 [Polyangiaceae bacterium]|jgi:hypothetical protein